jgi:hypothetical protein
LNIPALPVYIPALDSIEVEIAFNPSNEGIYNAQISAVTPLSKVTADLSASFRKTILSLSESIHSFGKFEYCNLPLNKTFTIYNKGMLGDTVAVVLSKNNTGYSVDKSRVVLNANDSAEITATFNPQIARLGLNSGGITLSSATCKNTFEIELAAELHEPDLSISPISLSYNNVWFGDTLVRQITVTNTSDLPVTITKQSITTNAKRYLLDLVLPQDLQPKSSISFKIALIAELSGSFRDTLYFEYRSSCNYDSLISMISYVPDEVYSINLQVPDYIELPYQDIALDVSLTESVYKFRPDSMHFELAFDPWLFNPTSVHYKSDLGYIELSSDILPGGTISIKVPNVFADTLFLTKGTKFRILGKTFPSSPNKTPLDLRGINLFSNKRIDIKDDDGTLEISPVCHPTAGQHLILSGIISLLIKNEVVTDRVLELEINSTSKTFSFLSIYSVTGNKLINLNLSLEKGLNRKALELNEIPNGIYYIYLMAASGQIISRKFIILN